MAVESCQWRSACACLVSFHVPRPACPYRVPPLHSHQYCTQLRDVDHFRNVSSFLSRFNSPVQVLRNHSAIPSSAGAGRRALVRRAHVGDRPIFGHLSPHCERLAWLCCVYCKRRSATPRTGRDCFAVTGTRSIGAAALSASAAWLERGSQHRQRMTST
jgi:hypothetical protein